MFAKTADSKSFVQDILGTLFRRLYSVDVQGLVNIPRQNAVLMLGNYTSQLDMVALQAACPRLVYFVVPEEARYKKWYWKGLFWLFRIRVITKGQNVTLAEQVKQRLDSGKIVCQFFENGFSYGNQPAEFLCHAEKVVLDTSTDLSPFYLYGLQHKWFFGSGSKQRIKSGAVVMFGQSLPANMKKDVIKERIHDLSVEAWQYYADTLEPVPLAWLRTAKQKGSAMCLADMTDLGQRSHYEVMASTFVISHFIKKHSAEDHVGLFLPTSSMSVISNLAVLLSGKIVVNLNYTANQESLQSAMVQAGIRNVYTSRRFISHLQQRGVLSEQLFSRVNMHYLEDLGQQVHSAYKLMVYMAAISLPAAWLYYLFGKHVDIQNTAGIMFSSGSEGMPKGVMLSHRNFMANIQQTMDVLRVRPDDVMLNNLPIFHSFGFTVTSLMPMVGGIPVICHTNPTETLTIAQGVARYQATLFFGTSTFLRLFVLNERVDPLMLSSVRLVVAGAEKLSAEVRSQFSSKFKKEIYEGYGVTETAPVASVNIPDSLNPYDWVVKKGHKAGTVGLPIPGTQFMIVEPDSMKILPVGEAGLILISGPQVMLGYLGAPAKTADAIVELNGQRWYKTGDKGYLDDEGYLTIVDRYSRFAKIAGEMISLGFIEKAIRENLDEAIDILATAIPDGKKGEKIVLLFAGEIALDDLRQCIDQSGLNPLMKPHQLLAVDSIPKLGSGKTDFSRAKQLALQTDERL